MLTVTVEKSSELRSAAADIPVMLQGVNDVLEAERLAPMLSRGKPSGRPKPTLASKARDADLHARRRSLVSVLGGLRDAAFDIADDAPEPADENVTDTYDATMSRMGTPVALRDWIRASANAHTHMKASRRRQARQWAIYRDSLADLAMGEWNVLVRAWAGAVQDTYRAEAVEAGPRVVPIPLNL